MVRRRWLGRLPTNAGALDRVQLRWKATSDLPFVASDGWIDLASTAADHLVTGLSNGTNYTFELRVGNALGDSEAIAVTATPTAAPSKPTGFTASMGDGQVSLNWSDPSDSSITKYQLRHKAGSSFAEGDDDLWADIAGSGSGTTGHTVTGLANGTEHVFELRAVNANGTGRVSDALTATPILPIPGALTSLSAVASDRDVLLAWELPTNASVLDKVQLRWTRASALPFDATDGWIDLAATAVTHRVTGLSGGIRYVFELRASNASGDGPAVTVTTSTDTWPPKPSGFMVRAGDGRVTLSWDDPSNSDIGRYRLRYKAGSSFAADDNLWAYIPDSGSGTTGHTVSGLTNGVEYVFQILPVGFRQINGYLTIYFGEASTPLTAVPSATPVKPTGFKARVGDGQVTLSWDAPLNDSITKYQLRRKAGSSFSAGDDDLWADIAGSGPDTTGHTVSGLTNGSEHVFQIRAVSAKGTGAVSASATATPLAAPSKPTGLTVAVGDGQAVLSWTDPSDDSITKYQLRHKAGSSFAAGDDDLWADIAGSGSGTVRHAFSGLTNGTEHVFQLRAANVSGAGAVSDEVTATPLAVPSRPTNLTAMASYGQVSLSWTLPSDSGVLDRVQLRWKATSDLPFVGSDSWTGLGATAVTHLVSGLTSGTEYTFELRAGSASGDGEAATVTATPTLVPSKPGGFVATAGDGRVSLSWSDPANASITKYQLRRKAGSSFVADDDGLWADIAGSGSGTTGHVVSGLANGTGYVFELRAVNASGAGAVSDSATATPELAVPEAPTALSGIGSDGEMLLSWALPTNASMLDKMQLRWKATSELPFGADDSWTDLPATAVTYRVSGLTDGVSHTFELRGSNASGDGASASLTTPVPLKPAGIVARVGDGQVALSWSDPTDDSITKYQLRWKAGASFAPDDDLWADIPGSGAGTVRHAFSGLSNGTTHVFQLRAVNAFGAGAASDEVTATPLTVPEGPTGLMAVAGYREMSLSWDSPVSASMVDKVQLRWKATSDLPFVVSDDWTDLGAATVAHRVSGLVGGREYAFELRFGNVSGEGDPASVKAVPLAVPVAPSGLVATPGFGRVVLSWSDPSNASVTRYQLRWKAGSGFGAGDDGLWADIEGSGASTTGHVVTGLANGTRYAFELRAVNHNGIGRNSDTVTATPMLPRPSAPTGLAATGEDGQVALSWNNPNDSSITAYQIRQKKGASFSDADTWSNIAGSNADTTSHVVTGIENGVRYAFQIRSANASGESSPSRNGNGDTRLPPRQADRNTDSRGQCRGQANLGRPV